MTVVGDSAGPAGPTRWLITIAARGARDDEQDDRSRQARPAPRAGRRLECRVRDGGGDPGEPGRDLSRRARVIRPIGGEEVLQQGRRIRRRPGLTGHHQPGRRAAASEQAEQEDAEAVEVVGRSSGAVGRAHERAAVRAQPDRVRSQVPVRGAGLVQGRERERELRAEIQSATRGPRWGWKRPARALLVRDASRGRVRVPPDRSRDRGVGREPRDAAARRVERRAGQAVRRRRDGATVHGAVYSIGPWPSPMPDRSTPTRRGRSCSTVSRRCPWRRSRSRARWSAASSRSTCMPRTTYRHSTTRRWTASPSEQPTPAECCHWPARRSPEMIRDSCGRARPWRSQPARRSPGCGQRRARGARARRTASRFPSTGRFRRRPRAPARHRRAGRGGRHRRGNRLGPLALAAVATSASPKCAVTVLPAFASWSRATSSSHPGNRC